MAKMRIEFNPEAFQALLTGPEVQADLARRPSAIAAAAGEHFAAQQKIGTAHGGMRVIATVAPSDKEGIKLEAEEKVLTRALGAGR